MSDSIRAKFASLSIGDLEKRWGMGTSDVHDVLCAGVLRVYVHARGITARNNQSGRERYFTGLTLIDHESVHGLLAGLEIITLEQLMVAGTLGSKHMAHALVSITLVEDLIFGQSYFQTDPARRSTWIEHLRVKQVDVEHYEKSSAAGTESPNAPPDLRNNQRHKERCRAIAELLWEQDAKLTIEDMIDRPEITKFGQQQAPYDRKTLRAWIKDLCPDRTPGRRKKNPRPDQE